MFMFMFMLGGTRAGGVPSSPGVGGSPPRLVGSPEGGSRPNARAAASGLLVEAGRQLPLY